MSLQLGEVEQQLLEKHISMEVTDEAKEYLAEKADDPNFGARPLRADSGRVEDHSPRRFWADG